MRTPRSASLALLLALAIPAGAQEPSPPTPPAAPEGVPHAVFEKTEIDAGDVTRGKELPVTFVVRNTGDAVLKILSVKPG